MAALLIKNRLLLSENYEAPLGSEFFVVKSFNEEHVFLSMKLGVWTSTDVGNVKLDEAFERCACALPDRKVFLFFSVNASKRFCGVAEMCSRVKFDSQSPAWSRRNRQRCKLEEEFEVKWLIVKDIPNHCLREAGIVNSDGQSVVQSRDTQEIHPQQGGVLLRYFSSFQADTSLLDDFHFYECPIEELERAPKGGARCVVVVGEEKVRIRGLPTNAVVDRERLDMGVETALFVSPRGGMRGGQSARGIARVLHLKSRGPRSDMFRRSKENNLSCTALKDGSARRVVLQDSTSIENGGDVGVAAGRCNAGGVAVEVLTTARLQEGRRRCCGGEAAGKKGALCEMNEDVLRNKKQVGSQQMRRGKRGRGANRKNNGHDREGSAAAVVVPPPLTTPTSSKVSSPHDLRSTSMAYGFVE